MPKRSATYEGIKFEHGETERVSDALTVEEALQININAVPFTVIMQTPGNEQELVRGLLYTEDLYKHAANFSVVGQERNALGHITKVNAEIGEELLGKGYVNTRSMLSVSSCGICGKRELGELAVEGEKLKIEELFDAELLDTMFKTMELSQATFNTTGGSHGAAAFNKKGELLTLMEDIGRHNAVDKVIGSLLLKKKLEEAQCLLVSGRISYEIVTKAFMARIPVLAAVSAPSTLAVDYSKELGITLFGFSRNGKTTCYAHAERVIKSGGNKDVA